MTAPTPPVTFTWNGVRLGGDSPYRVDTIDGMAGLTAPVFAASPGRGHGSAVTPVMQDERAIIITGHVRDRDQWPALMAALGAAFTPAPAGDVNTSPLGVEYGGRVLTANAQLTRYKPAVTVGKYSAGWVDFAIQWRCPDPLLYGPPTTVLSGLVVPVTGIALPLTLPVTLTARPVGGEFTVDNPGTYEAQAIYTLTGAQAAPGVWVNGRRVAYSFDLTANDVLVIDTAKGYATLNGEFRSPVFDWSNVTSDLVLRPGLNTIRATGTAGAGSPTIAATFSPAYW
jgi:hypothetical protein